MSKPPYPYHGLKVDNETDKHWFFKCPFHKEDTASFTVNKGGRWRLYYRCWACGINGSPKDFARKYLQHDDKIIEETLSCNQEFPIQENEPKQEIDPTVFPFANTNELIDFAEKLGLSFKAVRDDGIRVCGTTFLVPMFNSESKVCGLQRHWWKNGEHIKKSLKHSKQGVFKSFEQFDVNEPLFINEGYTDKATMKEMGFQAIGKFNALHKLNADFIKQINKFKRVIIVSDTNECGRKGSQELANKLSAVKIIYPQTVNGGCQYYYKDIREMYLSNGAEKTKQWIEGQLK